MYITVQEAGEILGLKDRRSVYEYLEKGLLKKNPDSKKIEIEIESVYNAREQKRGVK